MRQRSRRVPEGLAGEGGSAPALEVAAEEPLRVRREKRCVQCTRRPERQLAGSEKREASGMWGSEAAGVSGSGPRGLGGLAVMQ